jgi:hypothetical protein
MVNILGTLLFQDQLGTKDREVLAGKRADKSMD